MTGEPEAARVGVALTVAQNQLGEPLKPAERGDDGGYFAKGQQSGNVWERGGPGGNGFGSRLQ